MIEYQPSMLNPPVKDLDANLGYFQKEFKLKGKGPFTLRDCESDVATSWVLLVSK